MKRLLSVLLLLALATPGVAEANRHASSNAKILRGVQRAKQRNRKVLRPPPPRSGSLAEVLKAFARRHPYTLGHSMRVAGYVEAMARELGYAEVDVAAFSRASMVHDIGKLKVPLTILDNKGKRADRGAPALSKKQYRVMKRHAAFGIELLDSTLSPRHPDYKLMREAILFHHERPDGKGYKHQYGVKIPPIARLIAVADVYDSLTSKRGYRDPLSPHKALAIINEGAGTQFDAKIVKAFASTIQKHGYRKIAPHATLASFGAALER